MIDFDITIPGCTATTAPTKTLRTQEFLGNVIKSNKLEYLSHPETLNLDGSSPISHLFFAAHNCFAKHLPLALAPEVLMYTVLHELAITVKQNPDDYRSLFTSSDAKETIEVIHDGLVKGDPTSPWHETMPMFEQALGKGVPSEVLQHALPSFSTHTAITRASSMVAFMDMASPYYDYVVRTRCGIPKIRLLGLPSDWEKLYSACAKLAPLFDKHLSTYFEYLLPVLAKIADQANALEPFDNAFWASAYKHLSGSGTDKMTGWLSSFLNYVVAEDGSFVPKEPKLTVLLGGSSIYDWQSAVSRNSSWGTPGIERNQIPKHVSSTDFLWKYMGTDILMTFLGGILSIENVDGYVTPQLGFAVAHRS